MRSTWLAGLLAVACLFVVTTASAAARLGESCDLSVLGAKDSSGFLHFDNALRAALEARDAGAVAALVSFPLRVNLAGGGHQTLRDAAAFRQQSASLLPVLLTAVTARPTAALFCNANGVMYANGTIWASPVGSGSAAPFRIIALNLPAGMSLHTANAPAVAAAPAHGFAVDITLSPKAAQRLQTAHEGITVWASWYGDPGASGQRHVDEVGRVELGHEEVRAPGRSGIVHISGAGLHADRLSWIEGPVEVNVNVYTSRLSSNDNLLACDFIDGDLVTVVRDQPVTLHCGLISEHIETHRKG